MSKTTNSSGRSTYPHLQRWTTEFGTVEIGHCPRTDSFIRAVDSGGLVWKGHRSYRTLEVALADADAQDGLIEASVTAKLSQSVFELREFCRK